MNNYIYYNELAIEACEQFISMNLDLEELRDMIVDYYAEYKLIEDINNVSRI